MEQQCLQHKKHITGHRLSGCKYISLTIPRRDNVAFRMLWSEGVLSCRQQD